MSAVPLWKNTFHEGPLSELQKKLQGDSRKKVSLKINDNRSTMLSVRWDPDCTKVSLHRMFLEAPQNIMDELACYVRKEKRNIPLNVRAFIENKLKKFDYSHQVDPLKLQTKGKIYDLQSIYSEINHEYFEGKLNLAITWYGRALAKRRNHVTFGLYLDPLKLIKIHRRLDNTTFPPYVIAYVIYHEMLHHICPSYYNQKGLHKIHTKEFKEKELLFKDYNKAQEWIKTHREYIFNSI